MGLVRSHLRNGYLPLVADHLHPWPLSLGSCPPPGTSHDLGLSQQSGLRVAALITWQLALGDKKGRQLS